MVLCASKIGSVYVKRNHIIHLIMNVVSTGNVCALQCVLAKCVWKRAHTLARHFDAPSDRINWAKAVDFCSSNKIPYFRHRMLFIFFWPTECRLDLRQCSLSLSLSFLVSLHHIWHIYSIDYICKYIYLLILIHLLPSMKYVLDFSAAHGFKRAGPCSLRYGMKWIKKTKFQWHKFVCLFYRFARATTKKQRKWQKITGTKKNTEKNIEPVR